MAALLVCHGKVSRTKTPQLVVSSSPQRVTDTAKGKGVPVMYNCREFALSMPLLVFHEMQVECFISAHPGNVGMYGLFNVQSWYLLWRV